MKYSWKGHKDRNRHKNRIKIKIRIKRIGQARLVYVTDINRNIPTMWRWACRDQLRENISHWVRKHSRKLLWRLSLSWPCCCHWQWARVQFQMNTASPAALSSVLKSASSRPRDFRTVQGVRRAQLIRAPVSWSKSCKFESQQERWEDLLLQS